MPRICDCEINEQGNRFFITDEGTTVEIVNLGEIYITNVDEGLNIIAKRKMNENTELTVKVFSDNRYWLFIDGKNEISLNISVLQEHVIKDMELDRNNYRSFTMRGITVQFINDWEIIVIRHYDSLCWKHKCSTAISEGDIFSFHVHMATGEVASLDRNDSPELFLIAINAVDCRSLLNE